MLAEIKEGKYNAILTWAPDRLSRNAGDLGSLVDLIDKKVLLEIRTFGQRFGNNPRDTKYPSALTLEGIAKAMNFTKKKL